MRTCIKIQNTFVTKRLVSELNRLHTYHFREGNRFFILKSMVIFLKLTSIVANIQEMPNLKFQLNRLQTKASIMRNRLRLGQFLETSSNLHMQISLLNCTPKDL